MADPVPHLDYRAFAADLDDVRARLEAEAGPEDVAHLRRCARVGRIAELIGYATAWIAPNPIAVLGIALGSTVRWTVVAHHVLHRALDRIPGVPGELTSRGFARGGRRLLDWPEWIDPAAWDFEHNRLHHYHTGEIGDPDLPEEQLALMRTVRAPLWLKHLVLGFYMLTWKFTYYAPNTFTLLRREERRKAEGRPRDTSASMVDVSLPRAWSPHHADGLRFWARCVLPYAALRFGVLPALFLPLGRDAWLAVLVNSALAEAVANLHAFLVIVPNHAGDDVHRFDRPATDKAEYYVRQVLGSVNMRTGGFWNDLLHGWLNYQIEHHLWPDLSPLQYAKAAPEVRAICARHGVPYVQEPVWRRVRQLVRVVTGQASMIRSETRAKHERSPALEPVATPG
ncbi:MAG: hypothetical protein RLZZ299_2574 [Pseudomonadota bacterium]|jgi:fatty acid desaturase